MDAATYVPAVKITSPPPLALHLSIARLIAGVSLVSPSPFAPKSRTFTLAGPNVGNGKFGGVQLVVTGSVSPAAIIGTAQTINARIRFTCSLLCSESRNR